MVKIKPRIITSGLSGMVGSRVAELLSDKFQFFDLAFPRYNTLDFKSLESFFKREHQAEVVLHLAAFTDVALAWEERGDKDGSCYQVNVIGTRNIAQLCREFRKYLIFISTDFVFDGQNEKAYTEEDKTNPIDWYGQTKLWAEKEVQNNLDDYAIIRIAFPFRAKFELKIDLVRRIIKSLKERNLYPMFADQITTPTFIDDIAYGLERFFEVKPTGIFHLVASSFQSPYQSANRIAEVFGFDKTQIKKGSLADYQKTQPSDSRPWQKNLALSNKKVRRTLGVTMRTLTESLKEMKKQMSLVR